MPIHHKDPHNYPNYQEDENEDQNPVSDRKSIAASGAKSTGNKPVDIYENWYDDKERKRNVDKLFGVMLEQKENGQSKWGT